MGKQKKFLRKIRVIEIEKADGNKKLFQGAYVAGTRPNVDRFFARWINIKPSKPADRAHIKVCKLIENGTFPQIIGSVFGAYLKDGANSHEVDLFIEQNKSKLRNLCIKNDHQIIEVLDKYSDELFKNDTSRTTFFLREDEGTVGFFFVEVSFSKVQGAAQDFTNFFISINTFDGIIVHKAALDYYFVFLQSED